MASQNGQDRRDSSGSPSPPAYHDGMLASDLIATPALQNLLDRTFGSEGDPVLRTFGTPGEALMVEASDSENVTDRLRERFQLRLDLAALTRFPEGYNFVHRVADTEQSVIFLSPPNQVAVQHPDGTWSRRQRQMADGPSPYTQQWYLEYLRNNNLPGWFLSGEHTACLEDDSEALWLNVPNTTTRQPPPPRYLDFRYPAQPQLPVRDAFQDKKPYIYHLNVQEQLGVARRFPATNAIGSDTNYRIYVLPTGEIVIRHGQPSAATNVMASGSMPWQTNTEGNDLASYRLAPATSPAPTGAATTAATSTSPPQRTAGTAETLQDIARDDGGFPHLGQRPQGEGHWEWLEEGVDDIRARELGFNNQEDVELARQEGLLTRGMGANAGPMTVWYPDPNFFNPSVQPHGNGHWAYHTIHGDGSDLAEVHLQLGDQEAYGFAGNRIPTAREVWQLRQRSQRLLANREIDADPTENVNLVWIAGEMDADDALAFWKTPEPESPDGAAPQQGHAIGDIDPTSGELHEPQNGGEHDQTGDGTAQYHTRMINGKKYTLDRSVARQHVTEPRKTWIVTKKGQWEQYAMTPTLDWLAEASIKKLNHWRETRLKRNGWTTKRGENRANYSDEERAWLFEHVKTARGKKPTCGIPRLTADFNTEFPHTPRDEPGIGNLVSRLCKEYAENGGEMKQRQARGHNKRKEAEERKKLAEEMDAGEEDESSEHPQRKKAAREHDKREGEHDGSEDDGTGSPTG